MQQITLISVGKIKERYINEGITEYEKRLRPFCKIDSIQLKPEGIEKESQKIKNYLEENTYILDAKGKELTSIEFAEFLKKKETIKFVIGGSDGITDEVKKKANLISLSKMTFLHEMCKLFLIEQIYRSFMINNNRTYHK